jgi:hypothetical protein
MDYYGIRFNIAAFANCIRGANMDAMSKVIKKMLSNNA